MTYAQAEPYIEPAGSELVNVATANPSWDPEIQPAAVEQDSWLVSFVDVLTLLLTLFVLLLAWENSPPDSGDDIMPVTAVNTEYTADVTPDGFKPQGNEQFLAHWETVAQDTSSTREWHFTDLFLHHIVRVEILNTETRDETASLIPEPVSDSALQSHQAELEPQRQNPEPVTSTDWLGLQDETLVSLVPGPDSHEPVPMSALIPVTESTTDILALPALDSDAEAVEPVSDANVISSVEPLEPQVTQMQAVSQPASVPVPDTNPVEQVLESLLNSDLGSRIELSEHSGGVNLEISDNILFVPAGAELSVTGMLLLEELAVVLTTLPYAVSVEGHTDNIPISTTRFPSNWELSSARATIVARHLISKGVSPKRIRAIGYADTHPRADNITPVGRTKNRRVSLVLEIPAAADTQGAVISN